MAPTQLPLWFRLGVKRVDPRLVLQYIPPQSKDPRGCPDRFYPQGVWYVCGKLRRNGGWISKRAVFPLADPEGNPLRPTQSLLRLLRVARNERRRRGVNRIEQAVENAIDASARAREEKSREEAMEQVVDGMRRLNLTSYGRPRVFLSDTQPAGS